MLPLGLDSYTTDWLDLLGRWLHVVAAIAWIGTSFYYIALDYHLVPRRADDEVGGESWEIHGGGFYRVEKYRVAPAELPEQLHWFKWEAYTTWLSGFFLFVVLYYAHARASLIDPGVADLEPWLAVLLSIGLLLGAWVVYDGLCLLLEGRDRLLGAVVAGLVVGAAYGVSHLFAARAAYVQVGAMLGTIMAANVLFVIIPGQRELVRAKTEGREPDPAYGVKGKQRSVHNNYLTLPVVFTMLSNHFPITYGHSYSWAVLVSLMAIGVWIRHAFNLHHQGRPIGRLWAIPVTAAMAIAAVAVVIRPGSSPPATAASIREGKALFASAGCGTCHALADAGAAGKIGPSLDALKPSRAAVIQQVTNGGGAMPAFRTQLSAAQIAAVADYVASVAGR
jgi:uncharacterized membrane protein